MAAITIYPNDRFKSRLQKEAKRQHRTVSNLVLSMLEEAVRQPNRPRIRTMGDLRPFLGTISKETGEAMEGHIRKRRALSDRQAKERRAEFAKLLQKRKRSA